MSQYDFCGYRDIYVEFSQLINFMPVKQRAYHMNLRITSHITVASSEFSVLARLFLLGRLW